MYMFTPCEICGITLLHYSSKSEYNLGPYLFTVNTTGTRKFYCVPLNTARRGAVVEALRYKPEGRRIDSRWCH
jgi:hypothetical protein